MEKQLVILEVSQKQAYIFKSNKLRDNVRASAQINAVTGSGFFANAAPRYYHEDQNMVYSGGGHTVLQFDNAQQATAFIRLVTQKAMEQYPGLELFAKQLAYCPEKTPGENLKVLSAALEAKKATRKTSFRQLSLGVEKTAENKSGAEEEILSPPQGYRFFRMPEELENDNFVAVVHIDGNGMGKRVNDIYAAQPSWQDCCRTLRSFSEGIQNDFTAAFEAVVQAVKPYAATPQNQQEAILPIRPVILAGDDVCFLTAGRLGLECAAIYIDALGRMENREQPGQPYAACAGVAMVHRKYPFHRAYDLAEELCSSAKRFGAAIEPNGGVCAMDWHIEFGQLKDGLAEIRADYQTQDGNSLTLRPVALKVPAGVSPEKLGQVRTYSFVRGICQGLKNADNKVARSKMKELRIALRQGEEETAFFMRDRQINALLDRIFDAKYQTEEQQFEQFRLNWAKGQKESGAAFVGIEPGEPKRCLFFDGIEMIDHFERIKEGAGEI